MSKKKEKSNVTRISASDSKPAAKKAIKQSKRASKVAPAKRRSYGPLGRIGGYFKGAWAELRQVHWPTRRATWGLTGAVLLFSAFFVVFITLLDAGFKYVFEQILR